MSALIDTDTRQTPGLSKADSQRVLNLLQNAAVVAIVIAGLGL